jgi:hypothetical protein
MEAIFLAPRFFPDPNRQLLRPWWPSCKLGPDLDCAHARGSVVGEKRLPCRRRGSPRPLLEVPNGAPPDDGSATPSIRWPSSPLSRAELLECVCMARRLSPWRHSHVIARGRSCPGFPDGAAKMLPPPHHHRHLHAEPVHLGDCGRSFDRFWIDAEAVLDRERPP